MDGGKSNGRRPLSWSWLVSRKRKCREKRKRERERERERDQYSSGTWKTNKALTHDLYRSRRHRTSSRGGLQSPSRTVSLAGFHALKSWPWRTRSNLNLPGFSTKKCRVRELEKVKFGERTRPALYRNRSPSMRRERAAVRLVSCWTTWKIPWMEEPGRLQSMGSLRVRHD